MSRFRRRGDSEGDAERAEAVEKLAAKVEQYMAQAEGRSDVEAATRLLSARGYGVIVPEESEESGGEVIDLRDRGSA